MEDQKISLSRPAVAPIQTSKVSIEKNDLEYPYEEIPLPSNGYFYDSENPLSSGKVNLRMMRAKEEDILSNESLIKKGEVLNRLMESLIVDKDVNIDDLLLGDKNALFIAARRLAYGDTYGPIKSVCRKFTLPKTQKLIEYKLLTGKDEKSIDNELKALVKLNKGASAEVTTRLKNLIISIDGNNDKVFIRKFVENELLSIDSIALRNDIKKNSPDLDLSFDFTCEHCETLERKDVPMTVQFFWPTS